MVSVHGTKTKGKTSIWAHSAARRRGAAGVCCRTWTTRNRHILEWKSCCNIPRTFLLFSLLYALADAVAKRYRPWPKGLRTDSLPWFDSPLVQGASRLRYTDKAQVAATGPYWPKGARNKKTKKFHYCMHGGDRNKELLGGVSILDTHRRIFSNHWNCAAMASILTKLGGLFVTPKFDTASKCFPFCFRGLGAEACCRPKDVELRPAVELGAGGQGISWGNSSLSKVFTRNIAIFTDFMQITWYSSIQISMLKLSCNQVITISRYLTFGLWGGLGGVGVGRRMLRFDTAPNWLLCFFVFSFFTSWIIQKCSRNSNEGVLRSRKGSWCSNDRWLKAAGCCLRQDEWKSGGLGTCSLLLRHGKYTNHLFWSHIIGLTIGLWRQGRTTTSQGHGTYYRYKL